MPNQPRPDATECTGSGGYVYTYEGPQFGAHIIEEPCDKCGGWHPATRDDD